jgi:photosystem II stability/assembly factor-like uncharacterized protein
MKRKLGVTLMATLTVTLALWTSSTAFAAKAAAPSAADEAHPQLTPTAVTGADGYLWMLGTYPCSTGTCPVLMRSTDGGKSFVRVGTPPAGMYGIEFANRQDGYGLPQQSLPGGPSLYQTTDSGKLWRLVPSLGVITSPVVTANGRAFLAVYEDCSKTKCRSLDLASSAVTSDSWTLEPLPLSRQALNYPDYYEVGMTAFGSKLWVAVTSAIGKTVLFVSNDGGHNVSVLPSDGLGGLRCDLSATSPKVLWGHCITGLFGYFVRSSDGGQSFLTLRPPGEYAANNNDYLALSDDEALFDVAGVQDILITRNGGRTFVRLPGAPRGVGVADMVPLSATDWFAQGSSGLWRTTNGGSSWQSVKAPSVTVPAQRLFKLGAPYRISVTLPAKTFPLSIYPDARVYGAAGNWSGCPALVGVVASVRPKAELVARLLDQLGRDEL